MHYYVPLNDENGDDVDAAGCGGAALDAIKANLDLQERLHHLVTGSSSSYAQPRLDPDSKTSHPNSVEILVVSAYHS